MAKKSEKAWSGRFRKPLSKSAEDFTSSIRFDQRLYKQDIYGSMAYAKALQKAGVLTSAEEKKILKALDLILKGIENRKLRLKTSYEDIHMNIEKLLIEKVGDLGKKLHTGRSRNDQVATDLRMYVKEEVVNTLNILKSLQLTIINIASTNIDVIMPGYTHLQRAQPILFSHHMMAYFEKFARDKERFLDCFHRADVLPLGSGALAGTNFQIDRQFLAKELAFSHISQNSMDAVSDRDFVLDYLYAASTTIMHISRLAEEIILWSTYEFDFIELSDSYSTGSSMMPQKKNPDVAELARGKTGRIYGHLMGLLTTMKGLPLAYNKDSQEDKEPLFDTIDNLKETLTVFGEMLQKLKVNGDNMKKAASKGFLTATDLAYYLVRKDVPFRTAHEIVGKIIAYCEESNMELEYMSLKELKKFSEHFGYDTQRIISISDSIANKDVIGGTAPSVVKEAIKKARKKVLGVKIK